MKKTKLEFGFIASMTIVLAGLIFCFAFAKNNSLPKNKTLNDIVDGTYAGYTTCTCCGKQANQPGREFYMSIKHTSENKILLTNLEGQNRQLTCDVVEGKIIIDEKNAGIKGIYYIGKISILDKSSIEIELDVKDSAKPKYSNHCIGTLRKV